jgi:hypothetical protein
VAKKNKSGLSVENLDVRALRTGVRLPPPPPSRGDPQTGPPSAFSGHTLIRYTSMRYKIADEV